MTKIVVTGQDVQERLLEGARVVYEAVSTTLGPRGRNAIIQQYANPIVTHDGVTVARSIDQVEDLPPGAELGTQLLKLASHQTDVSAGDGTTTTTVLAYTILKQAFEHVSQGKNAMVLRRELESEAKGIVSRLSSLSTKIETEEQTKQIATISAEDTEIGDAIGSLFYKLGKDASIEIEENPEPGIATKLSEGYVMPTGFTNPLLTNNKASDVSILLTPDKLSIQSVEPIIKAAYDEGSDCLVIVSDDIDASLLSFALQPQLSENFTIIAVRAPHTAQNRIDTLEDIASITGATVVGRSLGNPVDKSTLKDLGTVKRISVGTDKTVLIGSNKPDERIKELETHLSSKKTEFEKSKLTDRITQLKSLAGTIYVNYTTEVERDEKLYLINDAIAATKAALAEGIVPGGSTTYVELSKFDSETVGGQILKEALTQPFRILMENCGERPGKKLQELTVFGQGFDANNPETLIDMVKNGIIDPTQVVRQAIENAVSVACSLLTAGVLVVEKEEKDDKEEE